MVCPIPINKQGRNIYESTFCINHFLTYSILLKRNDTGSTIIRALLPPASEGWGKVMFSVCSHLGGGGSVQPAGGGSVQPGGGQSSWWGGGSVQPAGGGGGVSQDRTYYTAGGMPLAFIK